MLLKLLWFESLCAMYVGHGAVSGWPLEDFAQINNLSLQYVYTCPHTSFAMLHYLLYTQPEQMQEKFEPFNQHWESMKWFVTHCISRKNWRVLGLLSPCCNIEKIECLDEMCLSYLSTSTSQACMEGFIWFSMCIRKKLHLFFVSITYVWNLQEKVC